MDETPIPPALLRNLQDSRAETRRKAATELESLIRPLVANRRDKSTLSAIIDTIGNRLVGSVQASARKGGLSALSVIAICLNVAVPPYLPELVMPTIEAFNDNDPQVRFQACETMYNIAKVGKGQIVSSFFEPLFLCTLRLAVDPELSVRGANNMLSQSLKDLVTSDPQFDPGRVIAPIRDRLSTSDLAHVRQFLLGWLSAVTHAPLIDLVPHTDAVLDGLFRCLGDRYREIVVAAVALLDNLRTQILDSAVLSVEGGTEAASGVGASPSPAGVGGGGGGGQQSRPSAAAPLTPDLAPSLSCADGVDGAEKRGGDETPASAGAASVAGDVEGSRRGSALAGGEESKGVAVTAGSSKEEAGGSSGVGWNVGAVVDTLVTYAAATDPRQRDMALRWIWQLVCVPPLVPHLLPHMAALLSVTLPALADSSAGVRSTAAIADQALRAAIAGAERSYIQLGGLISVLAAQAATPAASPRVAALQWVALLFQLHSMKDEPETPLLGTTNGGGGEGGEVKSGGVTQPKTVDLAVFEPLLPPLCAAIGDGSEDVVVLALAVLALLSGSDESGQIFQRSVAAVVDLLRAGSLPTASLALVVRQFGALVDPVRVVVAFCDELSAAMAATAGCAAGVKGESSTVGTPASRATSPPAGPLAGGGASFLTATSAAAVQEASPDAFARGALLDATNAFHLILLTASEMAPVRAILERGLQDKEAAVLFETIYRCWSPHPGAVLALCFAASAYSHAVEVLHIVSEYDHGVTLLLQLDTLVLLLESPLFAHHRLRLLKPKACPDLVRALYALLLLLPQSSAYDALAARLHALNTLSSVEGPVAPSDTAAAEQSKPLVDLSALLEVFTAAQREVRFR